MVFPWILIGICCEELKPKPKEKWIFIDKKCEETKTSNGMVCSGWQVSMYEVWKK